MTGTRDQEAAPGLPPLVLVTGDEMLLVDRAVVPGDRRRPPRRTRGGTAGRGGDRVGAGEFWDLVAPSLFAEPRLVVIRGAQEATKVSRRR